MTRKRLRHSLCVTSIAAMALLTACSPGYVLRAGWEEAKILTARRPIHEIVHDTTASAELRGKLRLVQHAREYSERTLELVPGDAFTSYVELERDTLLMVVNAAHEFELRWKTWWFPIVGRLPYKGYFDFEKARREAEKLHEQGYDTWVRPSSAFSTLGWFPDPFDVDDTAGRQRRDRGDGGPRDHSQHVLPEGTGPIQRELRQLRGPPWGHLVLL